MTTRLTSGPHGRLGLGTWKSAPGATREIVLEALTSGACRHIDSASVYQNQKEVGEAIECYLKERGGKREDVHVTSKLMTYALPPEKFEEETKRQLAELRIEKLDLLLLQWPVTTSGSIAEQWKALEKLVQQRLWRGSACRTFQRRNSKRCYRIARLGRALIK